MKTRSVRSLLAGGVAGAALLLVATSAQAVDFKFGDIDATLDTTVSLGVGIRTSAADCTKVGVANGGCLTKGLHNYPKGQDGNDYGTSSDNADILNNQWDPFTTQAKVVPELSLTWQNYGAFVRGQAYYDYWQQHELGQHSNSRFVNQSVDEGTGNATEFNRNGYGAKLLDAFIYGKWDVGSSSLNVRLGNQVINWGESLFIQGGINAFQPIDANQIVKPGSELKDAYTPDPTLDVQATLPHNLSAEAWYKFSWNKSTLPGAGTLFSTYGAADGIAPGQPYIPFQLDYTQDIIAGGLNGGHGLAALAAIPYSGLSATDATANALEAGLLVRRGPDNTPSNQGQFGAKLGYYADWLNDGTDMGFYFSHFHSNLPYLDFTVAAADSTNFAATVASGIYDPTAGGTNPVAFATYLHNNGAANQNSTDYSAVIAGACAAAGTGCTISQSTITAGGLLSAAHNMRYLTAYSSGINAIGYSFNTVLSDLLNGTALSGELNYIPKNPLQRDVYTDVIANNIGIFTGAGTLATNGTPINYAYGSDITPWKERKTLTGQLGTISTLPSTYPVVSAIGSDLVVLVGNAGFQWIPDLGATDFLSAPHTTSNSPNGLIESILGSGQCGGNPAGLATPALVCPALNFATSFSWGYRFALSADYNNALGTAWTVTPSIVWSHDVKGVSAGPIGPGFVEGIKKVKFGVAGSYQNSWRVSLDWTSAFGHKYVNDAYDKDYATATISYAF